MLIIIHHYYLRSVSLFCFGKFDKTKKNEEKKNYRSECTVAIPVHVVVFAYLFNPLSPLPSKDVFVFAFPLQDIGGGFCRINSVTSQSREK